MPTNRTPPRDLERNARLKAFFGGGGEGGEIVGEPEFVEAQSPDMLLARPRSSNTTDTPFRCTIVEGYRERGKAMQWGLRDLKKTSA
jgi:hypothetical protein